MLMRSFSWVSCFVTFVMVLLHVRRWKAEYRLVPDEQDQIEAVLRDLVSCTG